MEGILHVPPDRGTIIGRAIWKQRYVIVATPADTVHRNQQQRQQSNSSSNSTNPTRATTPASPSSLSAENMYMSIFKNKGDREPIQQHAISSINDCQIQMLAHRKQGPILPTLVISLSPDPITDKLRKRRSSRTAGLTTTKETAPSTLWFRPSEECHHKPILQEWCRFIQGLMLQLGTVMTATPGPLSPVTPASPTFVNPFTAHGKDRPAPPQPAAAQPATKTDDRPKYTDSPSLRSRRSDLSHTSSNLPPHVGAASGYSTTSSNSHYNAPYYQQPSHQQQHHHHQQHRPTDLPSPATTVGDFPQFPPSDFGEGFAAAQGRVSAISSPSQGRDSVGSPAIMPMSATTGTIAGAGGAQNSSSPPAARETILDRAFQMRFIPGSQRDAVPGSEKLSSLARFDALMREAEERKRQRMAMTGSDAIDAAGPARNLRADIKRSVTTAPYVGRPSRANSYNQQPHFQPQYPSHAKTMEAPGSGWDLDEDSDDEEGSTDEDDEEDEEDDDEEEKDDEVVHSDDEVATRTSGLPATASSGIDIALAPNALRALDFIAGRHRDEHARQAATATDSDEYEPSSSATPKARGVLSYDAQTLRTLDSGPDPDEALRPQTGYAARNRPSIAARTHSQPQLAALSVNNYISSMSKAAGQRRSHKPSSVHAGHASHHGHTYSSPISPASPSPPPMPKTLPRSATTSRVDTVESPTESPTTTAKRLSFTEFTKRLGTSTSSLLLVQTNTSSASTSSGSVHGGTGLEPPQMASHGNASSATSPVRHASGSRITSPAPPPGPASVERCGWRNSVNVITTSEGNFL